MSTLRTLLRRKSKSHLSEKAPSQGQETKPTNPPIPVVQIMRSTTYSQELLTAPSFSPSPTMSIQTHTPSGGSSLPVPSPPAPQRAHTVKETGKRLSNLFRRSRASSVAETYRPRSSGKEGPWTARGESGELGGEARSEEERQASWEQRATLLVEGTTAPVSLPPSPGFVAGSGEVRSSADLARRGYVEDWPLRNESSTRDRSVDAGDRKSVEEKSDDDIQAAIRLHESGDLETSTEMFGRLADPSGANNALAQVLYGLALRHGWGIPPDPNLAIQYLTYSARNASNLPSSASSPSFSTIKPASNSPSNPALKRGELTLAIYELGNCHRNGWGVAKSPALAMQYFEMAAELGDADAMVEVAMAWEKGVKGWQSGKKDRGMAARWYRRAERAGRKEVGNSWIWKEKYDEGEKLS